MPLPKGYKHTEATREKMRLAHVGRDYSIAINQEARNKISRALRGKAFSEEHKSNMSKAAKARDNSHMMGVKYSEERRANISKSLKGLFSGEKHPNWKGGVTPENQTGRQGVRIKIWKLSILQRDDYTCQVCQQYGGQLHVDHIKPFSTHEELRYDVSNGRTLCRACHYYVTFKRAMPSGSRWAILTKEFKECE